MAKPNPGDKIVVKTDSESFEGILMPRPSLSDDEFISIKLDSGYNMGLGKNSIKEIKVLEKISGKKNNMGVKVSHSKDKPSISIISTGGTISSKIDYRTGGVHTSFTAEDLFSSIPELSDIANIKTTPLMNVMSEDMNPKLWIKMAKSIITETKSGADGVVLTHGTDTMHYSCAALSFLLPNSDTPIILTGAQRSSDRGSSDTFLNLLCSTIFSTSKYNGVYLVMHGSLNDDFCFAHNGARVRKMHTTRRDAFKSINSEPVAKVFPNGKIREVGGPPQNKGEKHPKTKLDLEEKVALIRIYPGMDPEIIDFYLDKKIRGIVFEGTALGHIPTTIPKTTLIPKIEAARNEKVIMAMTTQCLNGRVHPHVYSNLREVSSRGVIYCEDMLSETAYVKLMWVLAQTNKPDEAKTMMLKNFVGEISEKTIIKEDFK